MIQARAGIHERAEEVQASYRGYHRKNTGTSGEGAFKAKREGGGETRKHPSGANQLLAMAKPWVVPIR